MARKLDETVQLKLRFSEALRRKLEKEATRNDRSMNTEIVHRLEQSFDPTLTLTRSEVVEMMGNVFDRFVAQMPVLPPPSGDEFEILKALEQQGKISVQDVGQAMAMVSRSKMKEGAES